MKASDSMSGRSKLGNFAVRNINKISAVVYVGAMILLIFVGLRFAHVINERTAIIGIGIEAVTLLLLAISVYFIPSEEGGKRSAGGGISEELMDKIRELITELSSASAQLRIITEQTQEDTIRKIVQKEIFELINKGVESSKKKERR